MAETVNNIKPFMHRHDLFLSAAALQETCAASRNRVAALQETCATSRNHVAALRETCATPRNRVAALQETCRTSGIRQMTAVNQYLTPRAVK
ncbi:MAG: hypothetical protein LBV26_02555 [Bacteroidales bacterium]|jgi:hypothetical protein|nr:hypothetical protein [Bacteroidales bacterium]